MCEFRHVSHFKLGYSKKRRVIVLTPAAALSSVLVMQGKEAFFHSTLWDIAPKLIILIFWQVAYSPNPLRCWFQAYNTTMALVCRQEKVTLSRILQGLWLFWLKQMVKLFGKLKYSLNTLIYWFETYMSTIMTKVCWQTKVTLPTSFFEYLALFQLSFG